ncbi:hypothetical protein A0O36_02784 [Piscirickettsiaceae bacterium NZ-RLO1]|nr:hypothetical protein A0O36_02784 [Piscirickettsiaceae bacterium NZ-RLO1]
MNMNSLLSVALQMTEGDILIRHYINLMVLHEKILITRRVDYSFSRSRLPNGANYSRLSKYLV